MTLYNTYSLCPLFFIIFLFFHQMLALQKIYKCFLLHLKSSFCSRNVYILEFTNGGEVIYDVMNWLAQNCRCNFKNNSKTDLYYIIKLGQIICN